MRTKRTYRYPTAICWNDDGHGFKHIEAEDAAAALRACPRSDITYANLQVKTCQGFQWVTEVPVHLGGITHHWHGERV